MKKDQDNFAINRKQYQNANKEPMAAEKSEKKQTKDELKIETKLAEENPLVSEEVIEKEMKILSEQIVSDLIDENSPEGVKNAIQVEELEIQEHTDLKEHED